MTAENIVDALVVYQATLSAEQIAALRRIIRLVQQDERERIAERVRGLPSEYFVNTETSMESLVRRAPVLAIIQGEELEERE